MNTPQKEIWYKRFDVWIYILFVIGSCYFYGKNQIRILGITSGLIFLYLNFLRLNKLLGYLRKLPPEIFLYFLWVMWSVFTGYFVAENQSYYSVAARRIIQMVGVVLFTYIVVMDTRSIFPAFWGVLLGAFSQIIWIIFNFKNPLSIFSLPYRLQAHTLNPNGLGFLMVWGTIASFLIFGEKIFTLKKIPVWLIIAYFFIVIGASGSRKSFLGFLLFVSLWLLFVSQYSIIQKKTIKFLKIASTFTIFLILFIYIWPLFLQKTIAGKRLQELIIGSSFVKKLTTTENRFEMYKVGLALFLEHPITGVGLDNFRVFYWGGLYSHSDYIETLADTGIVGFMLYEAIYLLNILRIIKLLRHKLLPLKDSYRLKTLLIGILTIMFIGLGAPFYNMISVFVMLTATSTYTYKLLKENKF